MDKKEYYLQNVYGGEIPTKTVITSEGEETEVVMTDAEFDELINDSLEINEREKDITYVYDRVSEYPLNDDQLDAIYKGFKAIKESGLIDLGTECNEWIDSVTSIKEKFPKP